VAQAATIYNFEVQLSDVDRGVYELLEIRAARHPSETEESLLTRVLAYCLEYTEGLSFSRGISSTDEPALAVRDLTGEMKVWIDVGAPDSARLHRASKAVPRVAVYTHKDAQQLVRQLSGERIHRAAELEIYGIDRGLLAALTARLERRLVFALAVNDRHLHITLGAQTLEGAVTPWRLEVEE
jgi:uncharacterized protein YaeQ